MPARILQIFNRYKQRGGEDSSVDRIAEQAAAAGFALDRLEFSSSQWERDPANTVLRKFTGFFFNPHSARKIKQAHERCDADVWLVHNIWPAVSPSVYAAARKLGVPVVQYLHNWRPLSVGGSCWMRGNNFPLPLRRHYLDEIAGGCWQGSRSKTAFLAAAMTFCRLRGWFDGIAGWIAISDFMRDRFVEAGWPAGQTFALRHSWETTPSPFVTDKGHYVFLGRLIEEKGVRVLLNAWKLLARRPGEKTPPLFICGSGPLEYAVRTAASEMPEIRFAGQIGTEEKAALLSTCRAVIAPALWWEPLGLTPYEAYDFQKPVLAAASGGLVETVHHERTGLVHPPGDAGVLAAHIGRMEADPSMAAAMGRQGRQWLEENASHAMWRRGFMDIIECVLKNRKNGAIRK